MKKTIGRTIAFLLAIIMLTAVPSACKEVPSGMKEGHDFFVADMMWLAKFGWFSPENLKDPTEDQVELCSNVFKTLCDKLNIERSIPTIKVVLDYDKISREADLRHEPGLAIYDHGILYISDSHLPKEKDVAHGMMHAMATIATGYTGFKFSVDQDRTTGHFLSEGIFDYFYNLCFDTNSREIDDSLSYQTHVAHMLAIAYGEDNLKNAFFNGGLGNISSDFNDALYEKYKDVLGENKDINLSPFEVFLASLDKFSLLLLDSQSPKNEAWAKELQRANKIALSIEEMLLNYAEQKGVFLEAYNEYKKYAEENRILLDMSEIGE